MLRTRGIVKAEIVELMRNQQYKFLLPLISEYKKLIAKE